jgi:mono/diheme cytochrome c family protein
MPARAADKTLPLRDPGLLATYIDGTHKIVATVPTPNFSLRDNESLHPQLSLIFSAEWIGFLKIEKRAAYTIASDGAPEARVSIDGHDLSGKPVELDLGDHPIKIEFTRKPGAARLQLIWSADFFMTEPVPSAALVHPHAGGVGNSLNIETGQYEVEEMNCVACHRTTSTTLTPRRGPDLTHVGSRLHPEWIAKWLESPAAFSHLTVMPTLPMSAADRLDIAVFLGSLKDPASKVREPQASPSRVEAGKQLFATIGCAACHSSTTYLLEGLGSKWSTGHLAEYLLNPRAVDHSGRMPAMLLQKEEALAIADYLTQSKNPAYEVKLSGGDAKHGEQLVQSSGCLNCHTIEVTRGKPLASTMPPAAPLEQLREGKGCLADKPMGGAMIYALLSGGDANYTAPRRRVIAAFIDSLKQGPMVTAAPAFEFYHRVRTFGCIQCHELNEQTPPDTTERVPQLTNIGGRLRKEWIGEVLTQKKRVRPWLHKRMPEFGGDAVGHLADLALAAAGVSDAEPLPSPSRDEIAAGQKLLGMGAGGLGCITCHGFGGGKPSVIDDTRGPDITTAASRLRPDHFRRWVHDPKRVAPSTPMPSFFDGVPPAEANAKVETIFRYVAMGENMPPPVGWIDKNNYTVAVHDEPVVIRAFMPNPAGGAKIPRGIAVGLPGLVNYCFDADTCTLRYAWTGGFLDMKPSWSERGGNVVKVLGRRFYTSGVFPVRIEGIDQPPEYRGYELVGGVPRFIYRVSGIEVTELIVSPQKQLGLVRTFELDSGDKAVTFTMPDEKDVTYTASAGEFQAVGGGRAVKVPGGKIKFSVTLTAKESK